MKRPMAIWILIFWLLFLAFGGLYGGIAMLLEPSGNLLQMTEVLQLLPVSNYLLPGLFLLFVMGVLPLFLIYGLFARPNWAWSGTVILGVVLAIWLIVQGVLIGFKWAIQYVTAINGLFILLLVFLSPVRRYYSKHTQLLDEC